MACHPTAAIEETRLNVTLAESLPRQEGTGSNDLQRNIRCGVCVRRRKAAGHGGERNRIGVDIWSDVVCPWCYIGDSRFSRALAEFGHRDDVEVVYRSFELDQPAETFLRALQEAWNARAR